MERAMKNSPLKQALLTAAALMITLAASVNIAQAQLNAAVPVDITKWIQQPDLQTGMDVKATAPKILADDFKCTFSGPITDVHIWASWLNDRVDPNAQIKLSIHSDIPAGPNTPYSHPGAELWRGIFVPGQYNYFPFATTPGEPFYDPNLHQIIGIDNTVFQYDFFIPETAAFRQAEGNIYWLDVQAITANQDTLFGWKTSIDHWNDDATWGDAPFGGVPTAWNELIDPTTGKSLDMAFALTTVPEPGTGTLLGLAGAMLLAGLRRRA
jgi:hypothetical protein